MGTEKKKYKFNNKIFLTILIIFLLWFAWIIYQEGGQGFNSYKEVSCNNEQNQPCVNPLWLDKDTGEEIYTTRILKPGQTITKGYKPDMERIGRFNTAIVLSLILGLILNHIFYNKKYKIKPPEI